MGVTCGSNDENKSRKTKGREDTLKSDSKSSSILSKEGEGEGKKGKKKKGRRKKNGKEEKHEGKIKKEFGSFIDNDKEEKNSGIVYEKSESSQNLNPEKEINTPKNPENYIDITNINNYSNNNTNYKNTNYNNNNNNNADMSSPPNVYNDLPINESMDKQINTHPTEIIKPDIPHTMYDAIFRCESINCLHNQGWSYFITQKFNERIKDQIKFCSMCFIGETNKGKTFIVNKLTGNNLKTGDEYKTEGLSCKLTDFTYSYDGINESDGPEKNKFLIFDTAGRSEPLLRNSNDNESKSDLKALVEKNYDDLKTSENFLKNLLINHSQIIFVIVNQLSLAEQIFLYQLKSQRNFDQIFVIHNLFNFETRKDLEKYINETIVRSIYFDITKNYYNLERGSKNSPDRFYYFVEKQDKYVSSLINHFILGNIETKDPWIDKFNKATIKLIKEIMGTCAAKYKYTIEEILEKELKEIHKIDAQTNLKNCPDEIIKEQIPIDFSENYNIKGTLKLDKNVDIKGGIQQKGINIGYNPDYVFYKQNDTEFVIEVECSGEEDKDISITGQESFGKVKFTISGKKIFPPELNMSDKPFSFDFWVNSYKEGITIDTGEEENLKKPSYEKGIYKKAFKMTKDRQTIN